MKIDELEIVNSYRTAAHPHRQVQILAELNACSIDAIVGILEKNGEKVDKRKLPKPKTSKPAKQKPAVDQVSAAKRNREKPPVPVPPRRPLTLGRLRDLCANLDDDAEIVVFGQPLIGLRYVSEYDIDGNQIRNALELVGGIGDG